MLTYWTFTGQFPVFFYVFGLMLVGALGAFTIPIWLDLPVDGPMWTITAALILGDILLGIVWIKGRAPSVSGAKTTALTVLVLAAAIGTAMGPVLAKQNSFSFKGAVNDLLGPPKALEGWQFDRVMGDVTITKAEMGPSYIVEDRSTFLSAARSFENNETAPAHELLAPHVKPAQALRTELVDNEIKIHGIQPGYEALFVTVFAYIETNPEQINLTGDRYESSEYRVLPSGLFKISAEDVERGFITLPLKSYNMTLTYFPFFDEGGFDSEMHHIALEIQKKQDRIGKFFKNGRMDNNL